MSFAITEPVTLEIPNISNEIDMTIPNVSQEVTIQGAAVPFTVTINNGASGFTLPLVNGPTYNFTVHWGDGSSDHITTWNQAQATHTYSDNAQYKIWVEDGGAMPVWRFNSGGSCLKLLQINSWGSIKWTSLSVAYSGCANLNFIASGGDFSLVTSCFQTFFGCIGIVEIPVFYCPISTTFAGFVQGCDLLVKFPAMIFPPNASFIGMCGQCSSLTEFGAAQFNGATSASGMVGLCTLLASVLATGIDFTVSFQNCNMNAAALNTLFGNLATVSGGQIITVTGNPGNGSCNKTIATGKGWTVSPP